MLLSKNLAPLREAARLRTNAAAEEARLRHITKGDGQMLTYTRKYEQALAFLANQAIDEAGIPAIMNEVGLTAPTKYEVAQVIVNMRAMWEPLGDYIEKRRLTASYAIADATNPAQIAAAEEALYQALTVA